MTRDEALAQLYALVSPAGSGSNVVTGAESMASVQREIVQVVSPVAETPAASPGSASRVSDQLVAITQQLDVLKAVQQSQADLVAQNTKALTESTAAHVASVAKSAATGLLSNFGLSPIVSGLLHLFGGGGSSNAGASEVPVTKYAAPDAVRLDAGVVGGDQVATVDRGVSDRVRVLPPAAATTQVTVQVNAMDSRSFLDRSDDIAKAVRLAMLESHAINDVVTEL